MQYATLDASGQHHHAPIQKDSVFFVLFFNSLKFTSCHCPGSFTTYKIPQYLNKLSWGLFVVIVYILCLYKLLYTLEYSLFTTFIPLQ